MENTMNNTFRSEDDMGIVIARSVFMAAFLALGLLGNSLLIACVLKTKALRKNTVYILTLNASVVGLLDCVVNLPLVLGTSVLQWWSHGDVICQCHAGLLQLINIELTLALALISIDRFIAVKETEAYFDILPMWRAVASILFTWIQALAFSVPVAVGVIPSSVFPSRYVCSVGTSVQVIYIIFTCVLCFLIPLSFMTGFYIYILRSSVTLSSRINLLQSQNTYTEITLVQPKICKELSQGKHASLQYLLWVILVSPHLVLTLCEQIINSAELTSSDNILSFIQFDYPEVLDTIFTWTRCSFPAVFAISVLCRTDLRHSAKMLFICKKHNSVVDLNISASKSTTERPGKDRIHVDVSKVKDKQFTKSKESPLTPSTFKVPVLFATSKGIHVQKFTHEEDIAETEIYFTDMSVKSTDIQVAQARKCDVLGSQSDLIQVEEDTSDYDSSNEVDRFSVSHPISSVSCKETKPDVIPRSSSNPEVGCVKLNPISLFNPPPNGSSMGGVMLGDSGIDISNASLINHLRKHGFVTQTPCVPEVEVLTEVSLPSTVNSISSVVLTQFRGSTISPAVSSRDIDSSPRRRESNTRQGSVGAVSGSAVTLGSRVCSPNVLINFTNTGYITPKNLNEDYNDNNPNKIVQNHDEYGDFNLTYPLQPNKTRKRSESKTCLEPVAKMTPMHSFTTSDNLLLTPLDQEGPEERYREGITTDPCLLNYHGKCPVKLQPLEPIVLSPKKSKHHRGKTRKQKGLGNQKSDLNPPQTVVEDTLSDVCDGEPGLTSVKSRYSSLVKGSVHD